MAREWYYLRNGETVGPVSGRELQAMATRGELAPHDLITKGGADKWTTADRLRGLTFPQQPLPAGAVPGAAADDDGQAAPSPRIDRPERPQDAAPAGDEQPVAPQARRRAAMPQPDPQSAIEADQAGALDEAPVAPSYEDPADALAAMAEGLQVGPPAEEDPLTGAYAEPIDLLGQNDGEAPDDGTGTR